MTEAITITLWITLGVTGYGSQATVGDALGCGGVYTPTHTEPWVAVPMEWTLGGWVDCGDTVQVRYSDGRMIEAPVRDTGCLLHYPVWDTGLPFGVDLPRVLYPAREYPTQTAQIRVWRTRLNRWWTPPPLDALCTKWCDGPLTKRTIRRRGRRRR